MDGINWLPLIDKGVEVAALIVGMIIVAFMRKAQINAKSDEERKAIVARQQMILQGAEIAYGFVNNLVLKTETKVDDKAAEGVKQVMAYLRANGLAPLSVAEEQAVLMHFAALHGAEAVRSEQLKDAAPVVVGSPTPAPASVPSAETPS